MRIGARLFSFVVFLLCVIVCARARADTLEAPIGGKSIPLPRSVVGCGAAGNGWSLDAGGRTVRPPAGGPPGASFDLQVAATAADCKTPNQTVKLVALGSKPEIDLSTLVLAVDEGRLEARGKNARGSVVAVANGAGIATDTCGDPKLEGSNEVCTWAVPKTTSADPTKSTVQIYPAGAIPSTDATFFDAEGKPWGPGAFSVAPARVEIDSLLPNDASVDVSKGVGVVPISHAEAVAAVDCAPQRCDAANGALTVEAPPAAITAIDVKLRLLPHVVFTRKNPPDSQATLRVSVLRCPMSVASGPVPRAIDGARVVVKVEGACAGDASALRYVTGGRQLDVLKTQHDKDATWVVLALGNVDADSVSIAALRSGDPSNAKIEGATVAVARAETRKLPTIRTVLELEGYPSIDFIPTNRDAIVHLPKISGAELVLVPVENVYTVRVDSGVTRIRGDANAAGLATLQIAYRVPSLPAPLDKLDLLELTDTLQRSVKQANVPAPFDLTASSPQPLVEITCLDSDRKTFRVQPGNAVHVPFAQRDSCKLIIHRERLSQEYGTQKLQLEVDVAKLDGSVRSEGHVSQTIVLRAGGEPRIAWIHGVAAPYDRVNVRLSQVPDEAHYLGALEIATGSPDVQWSVIFGTGHVRIYATTAIPTGLYRFGDSHSSGPLSLNFGVISRFTWLDSEGHEGLLGLEGGVMVFGLTGDTTASGNTLTQVGGVVGIGFSIPIANAGQTTQASINLHGWFEQRLTQSTGDGQESAQAIIFGPSISIGNVGTTF